MKKRTSKLAVLIMALLVGVGLVWAQQKSNPAASVQEPTMYMMMNGGGHHWNIHAAITKLEQAITQARESNDPAQVKAALNRAQSELINLQQMVTRLMSGRQGMMMGSSGMHGWMMGQNGQAMPMSGMPGNVNPPAAH